MRPSGICEVFEKAKGRPTAPVCYQKLVAHPQKMNLHGKFASYNVRAQFRKESLCRLHGLAVAEDIFNDPTPPANYVLPPPKRSQPQSSAPQSYPHRNQKRNLAG